ncbi:nitroreductase family deazaflavin-dependent oxidoreductase [Nocardia sp. CA-145437]|uniref:nitroreductase family deazaflavin-dependent oxidoreductase n=1 Tax=Nocardia sp. CA-145437 TaxID=3239980 RepID=UPI003D955E2B
MALFGRMVSAGSRFANRRGIYLGRRSTTVHVRVYRWSRGRIGGRVPGWRGGRILLLDHVGARSGVRRTSPLMYVEADGVLAVAASKAGEPEHPAWFHNLLAHPDTVVEVGGAVRPVHARVATADERERWWPRFVAAMPDFAFYQERAAGRLIPVVLLEPR